MTTIRLVLVQHRWVVVFAVVLSLAIAAAAMFAWSALAGVSTPAHCIEDRFLDPIPTECIGTEDFLTRNEELAGKVMAAMAVLPLLLGILVGVPLVGSEIETRTATIAWSLGPSRRRWLTVRLAILGVGLAIVLAIPAIAAQVLENVRPNYADYDPSTTVLIDYGLRGPLVVLRGLAAFSIGVATGLVLGRVLPALLVAGVAVVVLWNVLGTVAYAGWPAPELRRARTRPLLHGLRLQRRRRRRRDRWCAGVRGRQRHSGLLRGARPAIRARRPQRPEVRLRGAGDVDGRQRHPAAGQCGGRPEAGLRRDA